MFGKGWDKYIGGESDGKIKCEIILQIAPVHRKKLVSNRGVIGKGSGWGRERKGETFTSKV